ncbi:MULTISPECIES: RNA-guided endonuclease TnpB family protein [unclassified Bacillus (in: firmicutes)]|uniref:RNA-guided endonuclease TnpB family protein n=1 Tax=unclassified Bacillus (in: firmicutes) TaxID=185979 RepID=UPI0023DA658D|nr:MULTISPECIES: RNA-guided endonuclease TnpB family protein [unclassified Bacillus (in: firmicutes)]MCU4758863.1 transposase [Bacillus cereus]MDF2021014.1 RNA-guided endonuclease TnpB family protein [Bacillus sp. Cr_R3]MDF2034379.1 RNA-guided endonuclease TnpB family protein [Bacillus sp. Cr_R16]
MTKHNKAYKFRLYPTEEQANLIRKTFGCVRFVYNKMLAERKKVYEKYKENKEELKKQKFPTPAKYKVKYKWLKEVDSLALANAQLNLQTAYKNFFSGQSDFPTFKSKKSRKSYTTNRVNGNIMLFHGYIKLPKLKLVRLKQHREIPQNHIIKSCTISLTPTGKYYVSVLTEYEKEIVQKEVESVVGLDFAMAELYVSSEDEKANYPRFYRQMLNRLAKAQRVLARRVKGSVRWNKQRICVANLHEKVANQRKNFLHHKSKELATNFDVVAIEDLHMKGMSRALRFGKSVADNGWRMFTTFLAYKLQEQGKQLVKVDRWFPSTKMCSNCGNRKDMLLSERTYECSCGLTISRDYNAAINIKREAIRLLASDSVNSTK